MKTARHRKILELIRNTAIDTQEELTARLREAGFSVTQATVSRDLKDLRIVKSPRDGGGYQYAAPGNSGDTADKFNRLFAEAALHVTPAGNIVAVHCQTGMAQAICTAMDAAALPNVVATLAGDDTIFVLCPTDEKANAVAQALAQLIGG